MVVDSQLIWTIVLGGYVMLVLFFTRIPYAYLVARGMEPIRAVYYIRKLVHMLAGGVSSLLIPVLFQDFWYPLISGLLLTVFILAAHVSGLRLYWFQTADNRNDVNFALMWSASIALLWWLLGNPWLAVLPSLYMAFGDGVTGIARNALVRRRSKHLIGTLFMLLVCLPMGWYIGGLATPPIPFWGLLSALIASWVERYEFGPIDDNVLITISAASVLLLGVWWS